MAKKKKTKWEIPEVIEREILRPKGEAIIAEYKSCGKIASLEVSASENREDPEDKIVITWSDPKEVDEDLEPILNELVIYVDWWNKGEESDLEDF